MLSGVQSNVVFSHAIGDMYAHARDFTGQVLDKPRLGPLAVEGTATSFTSVETVLLTGKTTRPCRGCAVSP